MAVPDVSCSLPVAVNNPDQHGGFVNFPAAHFHDDGAESQLRWAGSVQTTVVKPVLDGRWPGPVWDWPAHRWIPAMNPQVVSPDGSAYVYPQENGSNGALQFTRLRVVTVSTGDDRLLPSSGVSDYPIAWTDAGIYVVGLNFEASTSGLRLLNPTTGAEHVITKSGGWYFVSGGTAWGFAADAYTNSDYFPHRVDSLDIATGKVTNWYSAVPPRNVHVAAIDLSGRPIIVVDEYHVFRLLGPNQAQSLFDSPVPIWDRTTPQVDAHGLWFVTAWPDDGARGEVWLYSDATGLRKVAATGQYLVAIEGRCL